MFNEKSITEFKRQQSEYLTEWEISDNDIHLQAITIAKEQGKKIDQEIEDEIKQNNELLKLFQI